MHALPFALACALALTGLTAPAVAAESDDPVPNATALAAGVRQGEGAPMGWSLRGATQKSSTTPTPDQKGLATTATVSKSGWYVPGIDTSGYTGTLDWAAYARAGYAFNYAKATEGTYYTSSGFSAQYSGSYAAGMFHGAYHFANPKDSGGKAQADYFVSHGGGWSADGRTLPGALDVEYNPYSGGTCYGLSTSAMVTWINDFVNQYRARTGVYPVVYSTTSWWNQCTGSSTAFNHKLTLWIARWSSSPGTLFPGMTSWSFWQSAADDSLGLDYDAFHGTRTQLKEWATAPRPTNAMRLGGRTRTDTAVEISRRQYTGKFAGGTGSVYLARDDILADATAAGSLTDGPILLVPSCSGVPSGVASEISRLNPARVVALGGTPAVCDATLKSAANGRTTARLAGSNRFETSVAIAKERARQGSVSSIYLASGSDSASDAVVGGQLTDGPVILVPERSAPPSSVAAAVKSINPSRVIALGATNRVSSSTLTTVAGGRSTARVAGVTRYDTAALIAQRKYPGKASVVYITRGDVFADAVASGSLTDGAILLVPKCGSLPGSVTTRIKALNPQSIVPLGSTSAVCDSTKKAAQTASG